MRGWWTPEDKKNFDERSGFLAKEFGEFESVPGAKLNGKLTLGENIADNGGLHQAYAALHTELATRVTAAESKFIDGYTVDQRYFLGYARVWCENTPEETAPMRANRSTLARIVHVDGAVQIQRSSVKPSLQEVGSDVSGYKLSSLVIGTIS